MPEYSFHSFNVDNMAMRYSDFAPRFFNFCLSLGMHSNNIMPSRAFCSDENQGYPIILIAKHFGTFPFNHGRVGGIVATDRHGPHSDHGKDVVIIQALYFLRHGHFWREGDEPVPDWPERTPADSNNPDR